jgi:hypothetical protein
MAGDQFVGNLHVVWRADQLDAEQIAEFTRSRAWELIDAKIRGMIADYQRELENIDSHIDQLRRSQGAIAALRRVLELPQILRAENKRG